MFHSSKTYSRVVNLIVYQSFYIQCRQRTTIAYGRLKQKSGRSFQRQKHFNDNKAATKLFGDDELYYDKDFDYNAEQVRQPRKSLKQLFKEDHLKNQDQSMVEENVKTFVNALYDRDEDDLKLVNAKRGQSENFIQELHEKFEESNSDLRDDSNESKTKKPKRVRTIVPLPYNITEENRFEILNSIVMPLYHMPYGQQLKRKFNKNKDILRSLGSKLRHVKTPIRIGKSELPCPLEPVRPSPLTERYRNKDEFSVWPGIDGNPKTVGFFVGQPSIHDRVICVEPDEIIITKQSHLDLVKKFQHYLRNESPYDICQNYGEGGHWRRVHIRSNRDDQHMVTAIMHPQDLSDNQLSEEMDRLRQYFNNDPRISSLYFHATRHTRSTHSGEPYHHLSGQTTITENLFQKKFVISPSSFFQVNTLAAEVLYRVIMTELNVNKRATVLDLCCGTGTLSILLSGQCKRIIGIDSSESAIQDAKTNADLNECKNIEFHAGTVEEVLPRVASENYLKDPVIAVVNPSRRGLHPYVVRTLKSMPFIRKLVYVSCKPEGDALRNFVQLCTPPNQNEQQQTSTFIPVNAIPVDLFPHTEHCELIMTFERF